MLKIEFGLGLLGWRLKQPNGMNKEFWKLQQKKKKKSDHAHKACDKASDTI